jgi:hypothetical protein
MNRYACGLLMMLASALTGCQSFSTTMLNRRGDNSLQGNSNGVAKLFHKTRPYKGIPITLKVPSHLDVSIKEVYYVGIKGDRIESLLPDTRLLNVETEIIKTDKVFTVDFKRPGAGSLDLDLAFNKDQYFSQIVSKLDDSTIEEAGKLAAQLISSTRQFAKTSREPNPTEIAALESKGIYREERTVAYQRFDINACSPGLMLRACSRSLAPRRQDRLSIAVLHSSPRQTQTADMLYRRGADCDAESLHANAIGTPNRRCSR